MNTNTATKPVQRRRMSPEDRRSHILDAAARVVVEEGVAGVSMDRVAREASVSKPLVYNYFDNRSSLLSTLLLREYPAFQRVPVDKIPGETFENLIRRTTLDFIDRYVENGLLIQRLLNEPQVAAEVAKRQEIGRQETLDFFGSAMHEHFGIDVATSHLTVELAMGITQSAARMLATDISQHDRVVDMVVHMIVGAAKEIGAQE